MKIKRIDYDTYRTMAKDGFTRQDGLFESALLPKMTRAYFKVEYDDSNRKERTLVTLWFEEWCLSSYVTPETMLFQFKNMVRQHKIDVL